MGEKRFLRLFSCGHCGYISIRPCNHCTYDPKTKRCATCEYFTFSTGEYAWNFGCKNPINKRWFDNSEIYTCNHYKTADVEIREKRLKAIHGSFPRGQWADAWNEAGRQIKDNQ
jgi:hypothetical protein